MIALTRRNFVASAAAAAATCLSSGRRVRGANNDLRIAFLGVRGKGYHHVEQFTALPGVRIAALCDPDRAVLAERAAQASVPPDRCFTDMRAVFDSNDVDAVVVATPNHWHALATVWACQAGKDVYVEKPCSHTIWEGRQMIAAARKQGRIVQVGTQRRSDDNLRELFEQLRAGELGKIHRVRVLHYNRRDSIGRLDAPKPPPASVDYNLWAGPAPMSPVTRPQFHYDWHWFWETGNGELGNNGPHAIDLALWVLGYDHLAPRVQSVGGRFVWDDDGETPNTQIIYYDYQPAPILAEIRNLPDRAASRNSDQYKGLRAGIIVECEGGYFAGMDGGAIYDNNGKQVRKIGGDSGRHHPANFIEAVRSRKVANLTCDIAQGDLSTALCHQGNISHRLGSAVAVAEVRESIQDEPLLADAYERMAEHLRANAPQGAAEPVTLGPIVEFDAHAQRFTGRHAEAANAQLRGDYRSPFVVPELA